MRTDLNLMQICAELRTNYGDMFKSAMAVGLSVDFIEKWKKDDATAREQIDEAQRVGRMGLASVLIDRAVNGVEEDVWFKGEAVGTKIVRSDMLLVKAVEAYAPEFKKGGDGAGGVHVNVQVNNMPRASNFAEWLDMKARTLQDRADEKALAAPPVQIPEALTGVYVVNSVEEAPAKLHW